MLEILSREEKTNVLDFVGSVILENIKGISLPSETVNGNNILLINCKKENTFLSGVIECIGKMLLGNRLHKNDKSYFMAYRRFFDKEFLRVLSAKLWKGKEDYLTGFPMLEAIGIGELLEVRKKGQVCFGFRPDTKFYPVFYYMAQKEIANISNSEFRQLKGEARITVDYGQLRKDKVYPRLAYINSVIKNIRAEFNAERLIEFMRERVFFTDSLEETLKKYKEKSVLPDRERESLKYAIQRLFVDITRLSKTESRFRMKGKPEIVRYIPNFKVGDTGRVFELNGIQGLSRFTKKILFDKIYNYDLKNSQFRLLSLSIQDMIETIGDTLSDNDYKNLTNGGISDYLKNRRIKEECAERLNISVDDWKKIVCSYLYGSNPTSLFSTIQEILRIKYGEDKFYNRMGELKDIIRQYLLPVFAWRYNLPKYCEKRYKVDFDSINDGSFYGDDYVVPEYDKIGLYNGLVYIPLQNEKLKNRLFLSAFILQGMEAKVINEIVRISDSPVISHEFDGILTATPLNMNSVNGIISQLGFFGLELVQKPFQSDYYNILTKGQVA